MTTFTQQEIEFLQKHGNEVGMATVCPATVVMVEVNFPTALAGLLYSLAFFVTPSLFYSIFAVHLFYIF